MTNAEFDGFMVDRDALNSFHATCKERLSFWTKVQADTALAAVTRARAVYRIKVWQGLLNKLESKEDVKS